MPGPISESRPLILGSASPRRREILTNLRLPLRVLPADVPEAVRAAEPAGPYIERIVGDKLTAVADRVRDEPRGGLLVADTIVVVDGDILGKPDDEADAERLLSRIVGRSHTVFTRYAIGSAEGDLLVARTVESEVWLRGASPAEIRSYARTGEGLDKAGAYAIQGIGAFLIERIRGSYTNVVGLPACEVVSDFLATGLLESFP
jgi:septum formation protein